MAVIPLTFEHESKTMGGIAEKGLDTDNWFLAADARIKTEDDAIGVGPVAYRGKLKTADGKVSKDGASRDLVVFFYTETEARRAEIENQDPTDIVDTLADFLANHGGDKTAMSALAPALA